MTSEIITQRVVALLAEYSGVPVESIFPTSSPSIDLDLDSMDLIEVAMVMEEEFEIEIDDSEWEKAVTVAQACQLIEEKVSAKEKTHVK